MPARTQPLIRVEQLTDDELDRIVDLANRCWQRRPYKLKTDPDRLTPLMACVTLRAYLAILPDLGQAT